VHWSSRRPRCTPVCPLRTLPLPLQLPQSLLPLLLLLLLLLLNPPPPQPPTLFLRRQTRHA
jgi:hypothetical protein